MRLARLSFVIGLPAIMACTSEFSEDDFGILTDDSVGGTTGGRAGDGNGDGDGDGDVMAGSGGDSGSGGSGGGESSGGASSGGTGGGSGGSTTGGTGGSATTGPAYWQSGTWGGCVFTSVAGTDSTISPTDPTTFPDGGPYCVNGTLAGNPEYSSVAIVGFSLFQPLEGDTCGANGAVTPTDTGLTVDYSNPGGDSVRLQLQGTGENPTYWCAILSGTGGKEFVPWASFNTTCWEPGFGTYYLDDPLSVATVMVAGDVNDLDYDYCVNSLEVGDTTAN